MASLKIVIAFALIAVVAALPKPQSVQQPSQIVPAPANFNQEQVRAGAAPEGAAKDLQGSASIGYGYYGGYPYGGYGGYSSFYGGYPGFGYGGYPYYYRGFGGLYGGYWY